MPEKPQEERSEPEVGARKPRGDESPEVEGHRFAKPEEPGAFKPRKDDESDDGEGRFGT